MKKIFLTAFLALLCVAVQAQQKRINLYGAYVFEDEVTSDYDSYNYFHGQIGDGVQYGAGIEFMPQSETGVELLWIGQSTDADVYYSYNSPLEQFANVELSLNYAMLGINRYAMNASQKVEGYGGFMLGALFASATNTGGLSEGSESATKFAWGLRLGVNLWASPKVGIKLQGQMLSAVQSVGGTLYFGTGGAGGGVSTYSSMLQFAIGGGLTFNLGK